jgi:hypothetical protein
MSFFNYREYLLELQKKEKKIEDRVIKEAPDYLMPDSVNINFKINDWKKEGKENRDFVRESTLFFYHQMNGEAQYLDDEYADIDVLTDEQRAIYEKKAPIYAEMWEKEVPGFTPLDRAVYLLNYLIEQEADPGRDGSSGGKTTEQKVQLIRNYKPDIDVVNDDDIKELLEGNSKVTPIKNKALTTLNKISLIQHLGAEFKVEKIVETKEVTRSKIYKNKKMSNHSQLNLVPVHKMLSPDFDIKFVTKDLNVSLPVEHTDHKQKIIIAIDSSGSMSYEPKQMWVSTILLDRIRYVMKGEAELIIFCYEQKVQTDRMWLLNDRESALHFWKTYPYYCDGGDTRVGDVVKSVAEEVKTPGFFGLDVDYSDEEYRPEILVIHDGEDTVKAKKFDYKVNSICLYKNNNELKTVSMNSQGMYVYIDEECFEQFTKDGHKKTNFK